MPQLLIVLVGYVVAVYGGGAFVEEALRRILRPEDAEAVRAFRERGLVRGGKAIGWLERFLTVTFLLLDAPTAVGLVLAAKGIIRYGEIRELREQKVAEYVLVGTMLSLSWAVLVGALVRRLL